MSRWLVQINGSREDLEEFTAWFPSGEVFAMSEADVVFLVGEGLETQTNASDALSAAAKGLDELFAVVSLLSPSTRRPEIGGIFREDDAGNRQEQLLLSAATVIQLRGRVAIEGSGLTQAQRLLKGSRKSSSLKNALWIWADPHRTWPRLYRMLEEIETHVGLAVDKAGLCMPVTRTRFRQSANVAQVAGKDARHAAGQFASPANPMSFDEATSFVSGLLQAVLSKEAGC